MAKGNLFLGTAARSVGDVVMYRREGSQVSRVRVRKIANPKTEAQCRQRAYMAPIPKFFSPLAVVLERSFEGLSKAKSYAKFIKVNADKARANDWLLPKGTGFFPLPYQLTMGTIPVAKCMLDAGQMYIDFAFPAEEATNISTIGQLSEKFIELGYQNGDVVTIILVSGSTSEGFVPHTYQFAIDSNSTTTIAGAMPGLSIDPVSEGSASMYITANFSIKAGAVCVARFENDKWRRSTQSLVVDETIMEQIATDAYKAAAIESYSSSAAGANPMVYLDGDELDNA